MRCSPITNYNHVTSDMFELRRNKFKDEKIEFANVSFHRKLYEREKLPKVMLYAHAGRNKLKPPTYHTEREDRLYYTVVTFEEKKYATLVWDRHKKFAEHAAALVCMLYNGLVDEEYLIENGSLFK